MTIFIKSTFLINLLKTLHLLTNLAYLVYYDGVVEVYKYGELCIAEHKTAFGNELLTHQFTDKLICCYIYIYKAVIKPYNSIM